MYRKSGKNIKEDTSFLHLETERPPGKVLLGGKLRTVDVLGTLIAIGIFSLRSSLKRYHDIVRGINFNVCTN